MNGRPCSLSLSRRYNGSRGSAIPSVITIIFTSDHLAPEVARGLGAVPSEANVGGEVGVVGGRLEVRRTRGLCPFVDWLIVGGRAVLTPYILCPFRMKSMKVEKGIMSRTWVDGVRSVGNKEVDLPLCGGEEGVTRLSWFQQSHTYSVPATLTRPKLKCPLNPQGPQNLHFHNRGMLKYELLYF